MLGNQHGVLWALLPSPTLHLVGVIFGSSAQVCLLSLASTYMYFTFFSGTRHLLDPNTYGRSSLFICYFSWYHMLGPRSEDPFGPQPTHRRRIFWGLYSLYQSPIVFHLSTSLCVHSLGYRSRADSMSWLLLQHLHWVRDFFLIQTLTGCGGYVFSYMYVMLIICLLLL